MTRFARVSLGALLLAAFLGFFSVGEALAQGASPVGDWEGTLSAMGAEFPLVLHVTEGDDGELAATLDSPSQGAFGIPGSDVTFEDGTLTISYPDIAGTHEATMSEDGNTLTGTWSQGGQTLELVLTRSEG